MLSCRDRDEHASSMIPPENLDKLLETLNNELNKLSIWLKAIKNSLNINKTYILFHRARIKLPDVTLNIYIYI